MTRSDARSFHQPPPRHAAPARRQPVQAPVIDDEEEMFDLFEDEDEQEAATTAEPEPLVLSYWNNRFATRHTGELPRAASSAPDGCSPPHAAPAPGARGAGRRPTSAPGRSPPCPPPPLGCPVHPGGHALDGGSRGRSQQPGRVVAGGTG